MHSGLKGLLATVGTLSLISAPLLYAPTAHAANSGGEQNVYRLYNTLTSEHLYTLSTNERDTLAKGDWAYEGIAWVAPKSSSTPIYRLYNPHTGDHHYSLDANEIKTLTKKHGWKKEGIAWYSSDSHEVPIYRQYNSALRVGSHHYTADKNEYTINNTRGWIGEKIAWYALKQGQQVPQPPANNTIVTAKKPTMKDVKPNNSVNDTITIPATTGVTYSINNRPVIAGTYSVKAFAAYTVRPESKGWTLADVKIVASPNKGYRLTGTYFWEFTFEGNAPTIERPRVVAPRDPIFKDVGTNCSVNECEKSDTITIPSTLGVTYRIEGDKKNIAVKAGTYKVNEFFTYTMAGDRFRYATVVVTAASSNPAQYSIGGTNYWKISFVGNYSPATVTAQAPSFTDKAYETNDSYTIPNVTGVNYYVNDQYVRPGTYRVFYLATKDGVRRTNTIKVTAKANGSMYHLSNQGASWTRTFQGNMTIKPLDPSSYDNDTTPDLFVIPKQKGVAYTVTGDKKTARLAPGRYKVTDFANYSPVTGRATLRFVPEATQGYTLSKNTSITLTFRNGKPVTPIAPTSATGTNPYITIPAVTGVQYYVNDKAVAPGQYFVPASEYKNGTATLKVVVVAQNGYSLTKAPTWTFTFHQPTP